MLLYVLIGLCLSLAGVAGMQLMYMFYIDRLDKERKKRVHELELQCRALTQRLRDAEDHIAEQNELLDVYYDEHEDEGAWADLID
jgi:hypothetical protein